MVQELGCAVISYASWRPSVGRGLWGSWVRAGAAMNGLEPVVQLSDVIADDGNGRPLEGIYVAALGDRSVPYLHVP